MPGIGKECLVPYRPVEEIMAGAFMEIQDQFKARSEYPVDSRIEEAKHFFIGTHPFIEGILPIQRQSDVVETP
jgi:hypothetical protein